jgi:hypothetical protein
VYGAAGDEGRERTPPDVAAIEGARAEVEALGAEFAAAARPAVEEALRRRLAGRVDAGRAEVERLPPDVAASFRDAAERAVALAAEEVTRRLSAPDVWLEPRIAPGVEPGPEMSFDAPAWVGAILRRLAPRPTGAELGELDDPGNRAWLAILSGARTLDPVLEEFGLAPSPVPDLGGGHFGLQPRTVDELDPSGELRRRWKRYRAAYERYERLTAR